MDDLDRRLVALLRGNARLPVSSLAQHLGVSRGTVQSRLDRLVERGDILGFTVRLRSEEASSGVRAITLVSEQAKSTERLVGALRQVPEATAIHTANGRWDIVVELHAENLAVLDQALGLIRKVDGVVSTETIILLTPLKI
jgi:DNA-binding Lrp family transcriptional regulator